MSPAFQTREGLVAALLATRMPGFKTLFKKHNASVRGFTQSFVAFHLLSPCDAEVQDGAGFHDKLKIEPIGLGHCSRLAVFVALRNLYQGKYLYAGLGSVHPGYRSCPLVEKS